MPGGVPVGTLAVGNAGAINAGLLAVSILGLSDEAVSSLYQQWREVQTASVGIAPSLEAEEKPKAKTKPKAKAKPKAKKKS